MENPETITNEMVRQIVSKVIHERILPKNAKHSIAKWKDEPGYDGFDADLCKTPPYIDYRFVASMVKSDNPVSVNALTHCISEGLVRTYPFEKTISWIREYYQMDDWQIKVADSGRDGIKCAIITIPDIGVNEEEMSSSMSLCGYFCSEKKQVCDENGRKWLRLQFEPKFMEDNQVSLQGETFLMHVTPKYNKGKILAIGFSPRSKNAMFLYPARTYFFKGSFGEENAMRAASELSKANNSEGNNGEYVLFKVSVDRIPEGVRFYPDLLSMNGIYTQDYVPKETIESYSEFKV